MQSFLLLVALAGSLSMMKGELALKNDITQDEQSGNGSSNVFFIEPTWNYYQRLNISTDSSFQQIKRSYRQQIIYFHPDKLIHTFTLEEKEVRLQQFLLIQEAYETLSDPTKRSIYDVELKQSQQQHINHNNYPTAHQGEVWNEVDNLQVNSIFQFFAVSSHQRLKLRFSMHFPPLEIPDIIIPILIPMNLYFSGGEKNITYRKRRTCPMCQGTGAMNTSLMKTCEDCQGIGYNWKKFQKDFYTQMIYSKCEKCIGKGFVIIKKCPQCGGMGYHYDEAWFIALVPCGFFPFQEFVYPSLGHEYNGQAGDLLVQLLYDLPAGYSIVYNSSDIIYHHNTTLAMLQEQSHFNITHFLGAELKVSIPEGLTAEDILTGYEIRKEKLGLYRNLTAESQKDTENEELKTLNDFNQRFCHSDDRGNLVVKLSINWKDVSAKEMIDSMLVKDSFIPEELQDISKAEVLIESKKNGSMNLNIFQFF